MSDFFIYSFYGLRGGEKDVDRGLCGPWPWAARPGNLSEASTLTAFLPVM